MGMFIPEVEGKLKVFKYLQDIVKFNEDVKFSQIATSDEMDFYGMSKIKSSATLMMFVRSPDVKYNHEISVSLETNMESEINKFLHEVFKKVGNIESIDFELMQSLYKKAKLDYKKFEKGKFNKDYKKALMAKELSK